MISPIRLCLYILILLTATVSYLGYDYAMQKRSWTNLEQQIDHLHLLCQTHRKKQAINEACAKKYRGCDPFYLNHRLEPLNFLQEEKAALAQLIASPYYTGDVAIEARYKLIKSEANRLYFRETRVVQQGGLKQSLEVLAQPVQVNEKDLKKILQLVEQEQEKQPQLITYEFKLTRQPTLGENEAFELNLKLLKREFLS